MDKKFLRTVSAVLGTAAAVPGISAEARKMLGLGSAVAAVLSYLV
jgi:hypothetical protein